MLLAQSPQVFSSQAKQSGFTIVELLVVVVVIAILASISVVAFNGIQERARQAKIQQDIGNLGRAIQAARIIKGGVTTAAVTGNDFTSGPCIFKPTGTDLAALPRTDACWVDYLATLSAISAASGIGVTGLIDPWGRPYYIDENEGESPDNPCLIKDRTGHFTQPFVNSQQVDIATVPFILPQCL